MRPLIPLLAAALILAACTRPLAPGERALAGDVFGPSLNTDTIRVAAGTGFTPRPRKQLNPDRGRPAPRPGICDRAAPQAQDGPPPAFTILHVIHIAEDYYADDIASGWAQTVHLPQALILTHELAHVWQWQNRRLTGYSPLSAALESLTNFDPYYYRPAPDAGFLDYGYEQQATLIEDYLCYALLDPSSPRRNELRKVLAPHFPISRLDEALSR